MKKTLLFTLLIYLPFFSFGQSISIDSFYMPGASWTEIIYQTAPVGGGTEYDTLGYVYKIERDTIISGTKYHLLSERNIGEYGSVHPHPGSWYSYVYPADLLSQIFAMLRVDSNRVYIIFNLASPRDCYQIGREYLFYDFNLDMGSIIPADSFCTGINVSGIDSVSLSNGVYVKKYANATGKYWIEGIGAQSGFTNFFHFYYCNYWWPAVTDQITLCYDNHSFYYHFGYPPGTLKGNLQNNCFDINSLSLKNIVNPYNMVSVYPNPATTELTITSKDKITTIAISNLLGQTMYSNQYNSQQVQVNIADLPKGIYFVKVNGTDVRKFVKL